MFFLLYLANYWSHTTKSMLYFDVVRSHNDRDEHLQILRFIIDT